MALRPPGYKGMMPPLHTVLEAEDEEKESTRMQDEDEDDGEESKPKRKKSSKGKGKASASTKEEFESWNENSAKGMSSWNENMTDAWKEPEAEQQYRAEHHQWLKKESEKYNWPSKEWEDDKSWHNNKKKWNKDWGKKEWNKKD
eukprot:5245207-Karenia_brevis.AAC.1